MTPSTTPTAISAPPDPAVPAHRATAWLARATWGGAGVLALGAGALYLRTLAPGLGGTVDSAEFQHAAAHLDIVHPTGYPLYLLLARIWISLVPFGEVAWRVNLWSAVG